SLSHPPGAGRDWPVAFRHTKVFHSALRGLRLAGGSGRRTPFAAGAGRPLKGRPAPDPRGEATRHLEKGERPMYNVVKRDGRSVDFNITRISNAITKAFDATGIPYSPDVIDLLALRVTADFAPKVDHVLIGVTSILHSE